MSQDADISETNSSQEVEVFGVNGDADIGQNEDIWMRADTTPSSKPCSNELPLYDGTFFQGFFYNFF